MITSRSHFPQLMRTLILISAALTLSACEQWNNPYPPQDQNEKIYYSDFSERPKHLDPALSYSQVEWDFIAQVYEPPFQYHFLKRPHELIPLSASKMPEIRYFDSEGSLIAPESETPIAEVEYIISIKEGVMYQPHPSFAKGDTDAYVYHSIQESDLKDIHTLSDFENTGTRELVAEDFVYQIKRLADPRKHSPIAGLMSAYIKGLSELRKSLKAQLDAKEKIDLRNEVLSGVKSLDKYRYSIRIKKDYPQFVYWLAMPFFAPVPWEADYFYSQPGMKERNISMDWFPVGTGSFMLSENNPNLRMVLSRNPNFHGETYPTEGSEQDREKGLLEDAGKPLPFLDKAIYVLEKETIPRWNKFLQGYYDASGISSDSFDQAVNVTSTGVELTEEMKAKGISLKTAVLPTTSYMGFNMLDPIVGGYEENKRKLRHAISIAVDYDEFISIFANGRGIAAQGPIPPGLFGIRDGEAGINPYVYDWDAQSDSKTRKPIETAKQLLAEAGYTNGIDPKTGKNLVLYYDTAAVGPDRAPMLNWYRKQFAKLGIDLVVRATDYNRFQEKVESGIAQIFSWGWNADYPDPENFFFLFYGPNGQVKHKGENTVNYDNALFDKLFKQMLAMPNGPERQQIIDQMMEELRRDAPWSFGFHPTSFGLYHEWYKNAQPKIFARNQLKYLNIDGEQRAEKRAEWNKPIVWPIILLLIIVVASTLPAIRTVKRRERATAL